ncbi:MAG: trypsin-like peptidase domain-containing protein [Granulosicoccaceae bacterium]
MTKRPALPYPAQAQRDRQYLDASSENTKTKLHDRLRQEHHDLQYRKELLEARMDAVSTWQPRPKVLHTKNANLPSLSALNSVQASIGQLCWGSDLANHYNKLGDSAGNISGVAWSNGVFLSDEYFLTAGHCFDRGGGWQRPNHYGEVSSPNTIALLFNVCRRNTDGKNDSWLQVEELIYHRPSGLDYAIVRLTEHNGSAPASLNVLTLDLASSIQDDHDSELIGTDAFLVNYLPSKLAQGSAENGFHQVQITQHEQSQISFTSLADDNTLSGTPLVTREGAIVGIKTSNSEALDIRAIAQILEPYKHTKQNQAQA